MTTPDSIRDSIQMEISDSQVPRGRTYCPSLQVTTVSRLSPAAAKQRDSVAEVASHFNRPTSRSADQVAFSQRWLYYQTVCWLDVRNPLNSTRLLHADDEVTMQPMAIWLELSAKDLQVSQLQLSPSPPPSSFAALKLRMVWHSDTGLSRLSWKLKLAIKQV